MSADNWTYCPKCQETARKRAKSVNDRVVSDYGKVSIEKYAALVNEANNPPKLKQTLREDYEVGIHDGEFSISYSASCSVCKFQFEYDKTEEIGR